MNVKRLREDSLVARMLAQVARAVIRYRRLLVWPQLLLFGFCVFYTVTNLKFDTTRSNLVGANKKYHQNFRRFKTEFPTQDDLVVVVESDSLEKNRQFVERLGAKLESETNLFQHVFFKGDLKMLGSKALLFVPTEDLGKLQEKLRDYGPFLQKFSHTTNLASLFSMINRQFQAAATAPQNSSQNQSLVNAIPALERILTQATATLRRPGTPPSPGINALFSPAQDAEKQGSETSGGSGKAAGGAGSNNGGYITFGNGLIYLITAQALHEKLNEAAVSRLRQLVTETQIEVPGLNVGLTGEPVLDLDEMAQSQKDTTLATISSLIICALIFIYGYQETGRPMKATACLVVGLGYTMGFATLTVGHLNVLTITFLPMLIGLAIDYGVHLISRYEEELRHGKSEEAALTKAIVYTGQGILTGGLTTAGAFLAICFTDFKGIQEMGLICGGGLLVCLIPMLTMLPALLLKGRQNVIDHVEGDPADRRARIENIWLQRPVTVTFFTVALCVLASMYVHKLYFDYNLLNMQSAGLPAVEVEQKLLRSAEKSVLFGAVIATNLEQAIAMEAQLTNLPAVASVDSMTKFLGEDQGPKLKIVTDVKRDLAPIQFDPPDQQPLNAQELTAILYSFYGYLGNAVNATQKERPALSAQLAKAREAAGEFRKELLQGTPEDIKRRSVKLAQFQRALFEDIRDTFEALRNQDDRAPLRVEDLPRALRDRFVGVTGKHLLLVYPRKDVWQRENQKEFIDQVERVDPDVTGTPVQLYHYTELLKRSYEEAARYSLIAIILLVLVHFRSISAVILSLIPVGIGSLWLAGLMGWLDIPLNPANIMTLPLVIGIGVTNGIHILNRFAEEQTPSILARSTGKAVLVSGLTSIAGFGSLMLAKHRGIQSLGVIMSIGLATCMIAGLTFLPALLKLIHLKTKNRPSADNARSTLGREEPR
jgi:uncharacterized protein